MASTFNSDESLSSTQIETVQTCQNWITALNASPAKEPAKGAKKGINKGAKKEANKGVTRIHKLRSAGPSFKLLVLK